jgi:magnesium chelatase family protein
VELAAPPGEASDDVRGRVIAGRKALVTEIPAFVADSDELLARAVERLPLSGRGRARVSRVARTIAALAGSPTVLPEHLAEALSYRSPSELGTR